MADGSDDHFGKSDLSSTDISQVRKAKSRSFSLANPWLSALCIIIVIVLTVVYSVTLGYQVEKPYWACEWAVLILASLGLSLVVQAVSDGIEGKHREKLTVMPLFIISLGVVVAIGIFTVSEFFVLAKPTFPSLDNKHHSFGLDIVPENFVEQNNIVRLFFSYVYNHIFGLYQHTVDGQVVCADSTAYASSVCAKSPVLLATAYLICLVLLVGLTFATAWRMGTVVHRQKEAQKISLKRLSNLEHADSSQASIADRQAKATTELKRLEGELAGKKQALANLQSQTQSQRAELDRLQAAHAVLSPNAGGMNDLDSRTVKLWQDLMAGRETLSGELLNQLSDILKLLAPARDAIGAQMQALAALVARIAARIGELRTGVEKNVAALSALQSDISAIEHGIANQKSLLAILAELNPDRDAAADNRIIPLGNGQYFDVTREGRYGLEVHDVEDSYNELMPLTVLLLALNSFIIAPEIKMEHGPNDFYFLANVLVLVGVGIPAFYLMKLFRQGDERQSKPWLSWLIAALAALMCGVSIWQWLHPITSPDKPGTCHPEYQVCVSPPPPPPPPPTPSLEAVPLNCPWVYGASGTFESRLGTCILPADLSTAQYLVVVGTASQEGSDAQKQQQQLAQNRAVALAARLSAEKIKAPIFIVNLGQATPRKPGLTPEETGKQRLEWILVGRNNPGEAITWSAIRDQVHDQLKSSVGGYASGNCLAMPYVEGKTSLQDGQPCGWTDATDKTQ